MTGGRAVRAPGRLRGGRDRGTEWEGAHGEGTLDKVERAGRKGKAAVGKGGRGGNAASKNNRVRGNNGRGNSDGGSRGNPTLGTFLNGQRHLREKRRLGSACRGSEKSRGGRRRRRRRGEGGRGRGRTRDGKPVASASAAATATPVAVAVASVAAFSNSFNDYSDSSSRPPPLSLPRTAAATALRGLQRRARSSQLR